MFCFTGDEWHKVLLVTKVADIILKANPSNKTQPTAAEIADYLAKNVSWTNRRRAPSKESVAQLLSISKMISKSPGAKSVFAMAEVAWGRAHIFDEISKLLVIVQRCSCPKEFQYVVEGLYSQMVRADNGDIATKADLTAKAGDVSRWIFSYKYIGYSHLWAGP
jgi:hypothetical protein